MDKKLKVAKIILWALVPVVIIGVGYMSYYDSMYHAKKYTPTLKLPMKETSKYVVYGDVSNNGFIFYPEESVDYQAYEPIMHQIATRGVTCVLLKFPFNHPDFGKNYSSQVIEDINVSTWYLGGHGKGGEVACSYLSNENSKVEGVVLLGSYATNKVDENIKGLSIIGTHDEVFDQDKYLEGKEYFTLYEEVILDGANHSGFGNYGKHKGDGEAQISQEQQWKMVSDTIVWFING